MELWQHIFIYVFGFINILIFMRGIYESVMKKNAFGSVIPLYIIGIFVWGDAVVISPFWIITSSVSLVLTNWYLFCLFISLFWAVRSGGESVYWFNQQFSTIKRNPPEKLIGFRLVQNSSVWFIHQLIHQCVTVIAIVLSIYFAYSWIKSISL